MCKIRWSFEEYSNHFKSKRVRDEKGIREDRGEIFVVRKLLLKQKIAHQPNQKVLPRTNHYDISSTWTLINRSDHDLLLSPNQSCDHRQLSKPPICSAPLNVLTFVLLGGCQWVPSHTNFGGFEKTGLESRVKCNDVCSSFLVIWLA